MTTYVTYPTHRNTNNDSAASGLMPYIYIASACVAILMLIVCGVVIGKMHKWYRKRKRLHQLRHRHVSIANRYIPFCGTVESPSCGQSPSITMPRPIPVDPPTVPNSPLFLKAIGHKLIVETHEMEENTVYCRIDDGSLQPRSGVKLPMTPDQLDDDDASTNIDVISQTISLEDEYVLEDIRGGSYLSLIDPDLMRAADKVSVNSTTYDIMSTEAEMENSETRTGERWETQGEMNDSKSLRKKPKPLPRNKDNPKKTYANTSMSSLSSPVTADEEIRLNFLANFAGLIQVKSDSSLE